MKKSFAHLAVTPEGAHSLPEGSSMFPPTWTISPPDGRATSQVIVIFESPLEALFLLRKW